MFSVFKNVGKKVIVCPSCGQRSRVPVKPGKTLRITCPNCQNKFEILFDTPMDSLKKIKTNPQLINNALSPQMKKWMPYIIGFGLLLLLKTCFSPAPLPRSYAPESPHRSPQTQQQPSIIDI